MQTVSLCMIVKNEEDTLERCLSTVREIVDEIIIVDTGSTDATKKIAQKFTDKVFDFEWIDDFSVARNFSFDKATMSYTLWLDADDIILPDDRRKFMELKAKLDPATDGVMMKYNTAFDEQGNVTFWYYRERLSKRSRNFRWQEPVHEYLATSGNVITSDICVTHAKPDRPPTGRNLKIYQQLMAQGKQLSPRGIYYYSRELKDNRLYDEAIEYFNRFLDSRLGWFEDNITACSELASCYEAKNLTQEAQMSLLRSFLYDLPRAQTCCQIGFIYKSKADFGRAAFWFRLATTVQKPENSLGFNQDEYWGYIPCIELAVCYDRMGKTQEAEHFNDMASKFKPGDSAVEFNRRYFDAIKARGTIAEL